MVPVQGGTMLDNTNNVIQRWISEDILIHMYKDKAIVILGPRQCGKTTWKLTKIGWKHTR